MLEIRPLLADYFGRNVDENVDTLFEENKWDASKIDEWLGDLLRTPNKH